MKNPYSIQQYSLDAYTVCIDFAVPAHLQGLLDVRAYLGKGAPVIPASPFQPELMRLVSLGFDYIDLGMHSSWIAAEIPLERIRSQHVMAQGGEQLMNIKAKMEQLAPKGKKTQ